MATQSSFYSGTALDSRTFPSTKHIATKAHMNIWTLRITDNTWVLMHISDYQLINNACVLNALIDKTTYNSIEVRVADEPDELADNPSDIAIVASISSDITAVSSNADNVTNVSSNMSSVVNIDTNMTDVNITADDIAAIKTVADRINNGTAIDSGGQFIGNQLVGSVMYTNQITSENLILENGLNGLIVNSLTITNDGSIEIQGNAVLVTV